jgi:hypothetical protein
VLLCKGQAGHEASCIVSMRSTIGHAARLTVERARGQGRASYLYWPFPSRRQWAAPAWLNAKRSRPN